MRIGIYPRKSVYRDNSDSVSVQVRMCKDYAHILYSGQEIEFTVYDKDEGFSGKNTNRPSFQEMMADVRHGLLDVVMVYKLDRISRNVQEFSAMFEELQKYGVSFVSVKETFDTSTPIGRTVMYILAAFAQLERENTSERVADNMQALGAAGKWTGGKCPCGTTSIRRRSGNKEHSYLVLDPDTVWLPQLIYKLFLSGKTITGIERYCRDHDITTPGGSFMASSRIYAILSNPVYCRNDEAAYYHFQGLGCTLPDISAFDGKHGLIAYGRTHTTGDNQRCVNTEKWSVSVGIHDGLIPAADWISVQRRLKVNKQIRSNKHEVGILKGVLRCSCGSRMANRVYVKNNIRFGYYYCQKAAQQGAKWCIIRYYRIDDIDSLFIDKLKEIRLNPENIALRDTSLTPVLNPAAIQADIRRTEAAIQNLTCQLQENSASSAAKYIIAQIETLDKKLSSLNAQYRQAQLQAAEQKSQDEQHTAIYQNICYLLDHFEQMSYTEKNEIVKKITRECVLDGDNLSIVF